MSTEAQSLENKMGRMSRELEVLMRSPQIRSAKDQITLVEEELSNHDSLVMEAELAAIQVYAVRRKVEDEVLAAIGAKREDLAALITYTADFRVSTVADYVFGLIKDQNPRVQEARRNQKAVREKLKVAEQALEDIMKPVEAFRAKYHTVRDAWLKMTTEASRARIQSDIATRPDFFEQAEKALKNLYDNDSLLSDIARRVVIKEL